MLRNLFLYFVSNFYHKITTVILAGVKAQTVY